MALDAVFQRFVDQSPTTVMVGGMLERVLCAEKLDALFEQTADQQYTRDLLFSTVFELMSQVVCGIQPTLHAAYQAQVEQIGVSVVAVYDKLKGIETQTSEALVRYSLEALGPLIDQMDGALPAFIPGYRLKIIDGNCLAATQSRLKELRLLPSAALPGKSLVIYDPSRQMITDTICCEDGYTQERARLDAVLDRIEPGEVIMADRNFCVRDFLLGIKQKQAFFIIREHQQMPWETVNRIQLMGRVETGRVYEHHARIRDENGKSHRCRRILLFLDEPTRDGETQIAIFTNLPPEVVSALEIARLYRRRWTIEQAFQELAQHLNAEINTLGYPKAALFAFCIALVCYNILAVVKAALRHVHGAEKVEKEISGYYLANELANTYRGMMIAVPATQWEIFRTWSVPRVADFLLQLARNVNLRRFKKHPRGPKKKIEKPKPDKSNPHVSTARVIAQRNAP